MPTYGQKQSIQLHPRVKEIMKEIKRLQDERVAITQACDHHFAPKEGSLDGFLSTKITGVYDAGRFGGTNNKGVVTFMLECMECGAEEEALISNRCPLCANKTKIDYTEEMVESQYFEHYDHHADRIVFVSCTCCDFRAAGLEYDR